MPHYALSKINANGSDESFHCRGLTEDEAYSSADRAGSMETIKGAYSPMYHKRARLRLFTMLMKLFFLISTVGGGTNNTISQYSGKETDATALCLLLTTTTDSTPSPCEECGKPQCGSFKILLSGSGTPIKRAPHFTDFDPLGWVPHTTDQLEVDGHPKNVSERDPPVERNADSPTRSKKPAGLSLQGITNFFRRSPKQPPSTPVGNYRLLESPPLTSSSSTDSDSTSQCGSTPTKPNTLKPINDNIHSSGNSKAMRRLAVCVGTSSKKPLGATDLL
ncbi:hypothetical protein PSTT_02833 [Puccinia striiformis]|uniref:Uncharacterized protein n=1 Tax=Puccinia striiformis TaxID=27350 RepID=A0A2S4VYL8_9BASI|nr:hypothetical protein PSTT_02833 [Puccinia striiformis]